jgi:hypothetical protein
MSVGGCADTPVEVDTVSDTVGNTHTNLVLRESLDDVLRDLLPWDIEFVIDEPVDQKEEENALGPGPRAPVSWCPGIRDPI